MGLIDRILSIFGGGSSTAGPEQPSQSAEPAEPETESAEPEPEEEEAEAEESEEEDDGGMSTKAVAEMADPRRREGEDNTVHNRAENPADHGESEADDEADTEEEEAEGGGDVPTKSVAEMADPRRREGEENTVHNRAENPDDQRAT